MKKLILLVLALVLTGCIGNIRKDVVLYQSCPTPEWVSKKSFEKNSDLYFVGEGVDPETYLVADRIARAFAMRNVVGQISERAKAEMVHSLRRQGAVPLGQYLEDAIAVTSEFITVRGLTPVEDYREKSELSETGRVQYRVVSLYKMSKDQYKTIVLEAIEAAARKQLQSADRGAQESAQRVLEDVRKNLEEN